VLQGDNQTASFLAFEVLEVVNMGTQVLTLIVIFLGALLFAGSPQSKQHKYMTTGKPGTRTHAVANVKVQNSEITPYDQSGGPALMEIHLKETFTGDIDGESPARALQVMRDDHSASLVSVQRFRGKLDGREGTFVLQGSEIVENGKIRARWFVVPRSGTGDLSGLRGEGGFTGEFGKGSKATLDYWFE